MGDLGRLGTARWTLPLKVLGAPASVHLGWTLVAALVGWSMAMGSLPTVYAGLTYETYWVMTAIVILGLGLSVLAHAFVQALAARAMGVSLQRITFYVFGGVGELQEDPRSALSELGMALCGPLLSLLFCAVIAFAAGASEAAGAPDMVVGSLTFIATLNLVMAAFNLLPAFPLDGGRALRAVTWMITGDLERATRVSTGVGVALSFLLMAAGAAQAFLGNLEGGLWTILIGIFLQHVARGAQFEADRRQILAAHRLATPAAG